MRMLEAGTIAPGAVDVRSPGVSRTRAMWGFGSFPRHRSSPMRLCMRCCCLFWSPSHIWCGDREAPGLIWSRSRGAKCWANAGRIVDKQEGISPFPGCLNVSDLRQKVRKAEVVRYFPISGKGSMTNGDIARASIDRGRGRRMHSMTACDCPLAHRVRFCE